MKRKSRGKKLKLKNDRTRTKQNTPEHYGEKKHTKTNEKQRLDQILLSAREREREEKNPLQGASLQS